MRVAVLENEKAHQKTMSDIFERANVEATIFGTAKEFDMAVTTESFDALVLQWCLQDTTSIQKVRALRRAGTHTPVLIATARDAEEDVIKALQAGADDFMTKPLAGAELIARVNAMVRRARPRTTQVQFLKYDRFRFDLTALILTINNVTVAMTQKEFHLAVHLFQNIGCPLSRANIMESVWDLDANIPSRTVDSHVSRLRVKLDLRPERGYCLTAIYGFGYRLDVSTREVVEKAPG